MTEEINNPMTEDTADHHRLNLRNIKLKDLEDISIIMSRVSKDLVDSWPKQRMRKLMKTFPEGQICIEDNGEVVAVALSVIVDHSKFGEENSIEKIAADAYLTIHDPNGDVLYAVDLFVDPDYRDMRLGRRLYEARKELCQNLNLRAIVTGGRIPGYESRTSEMTHEEYIESVTRKEIHDPILTFQLANDFNIKRVLKGTLPTSSHARNYAALLEWQNVHYDDSNLKLIGNRKNTARIGLVQWQMREMNSVAEFLQQVEYFLNALSDYRCDVALFPEFFNAPLMGLSKHKNQVEAIRFLAGFTEQIKEEISQLAVSYNINVVAGSMPIIEDGLLYNAAYLCKRDGTVEAQYKIHPTPHEKREWIMEGGNDLRVFDTDFGKVGILICYDSEFPELARILSEKEMQILLIPFWTDTKNGFLRVRLCAQARAIENECYVAIAGSCGNLPKVDSVDIQYAQSAVFSPSDFAFPHDAVMAETTPNTEMTLIVDVDLDKLQRLQNEGSVRNYLDRRRDLYRINWLQEEDQDD